MKRVKNLLFVLLYCLLLTACSKEMNEETNQVTLESGAENEDTAQTDTKQEELPAETIMEPTTEPTLEPYPFVVNDVDEVRIGKETPEDYYITNVGDSGNLYTIDENNVLWGSGYNQYGQLGQGTTDYDLHTTPVKIADDVIHVDYSMQGYVIYLTKDGTLYGMGNNGTGALMKLGPFSPYSYANGEMYAVSSPRVLMNDVAYARCGREDVVAFKDGCICLDMGCSMIYRYKWRLFLSS